MNYVREGDVLHVHSIDRLCRNTADLLATVEQLTERGVSVHFHKEDFKTGKNSPAGNMMSGNCCRSREWWLNSERSKRFQCQHADGATYQERAGGVMPP